MLRRAGAISRQLVQIKRSRFLRLIENPRGVTRPDRVRLAPPAKCQTRQRLALEAPNPHVFLAIARGQRQPFAVGRQARMREWSNRNSKRFRMSLAIDQRDLTRRTVARTGGAMNEDTVSRHR